MNRSTGSVDTGPDFDNTTGSGNFLYTEVSGYFNERFDVLTPEVSLSDSGVYALEFYYSMYGPHIGVLHIDISNDGVWTESVFSLTGNKPRATRNGRAPKLI